MIRVHTFIKYCSLQLQEAEAALQEDRHDICFMRVADAADSMLKSLAAALPAIKKDFLSMQEQTVARLASDLAGDPADAREAAALITSLRKFREEMPANDEPNAKIMAENAYSSADKAFKIICGFFT